MAELVVKLVNGELAGKTAQSIAKELNAAAAAARKAEIGTKDWIDATARLEKAKQLQSDYKKQLESTAAASNSLKSSFMGVLNQIPGFSSISGALSSAKSGVGGLTSGFGLLRGAIIATGIGALIIAVTALIGWFSKTEKGANMISGAFNAMGAVVDTLMNRLWNIGDTLKQLFSDPLQFFKDLGNDIATAAEEGYDLVQLFDELEDKQRDLDLANKQTERTVEQLLLQSKNVGKSFKERLEIIDQANKIEKTQFEARMKYADEYLAAVQREVALAEKNGVMNDELADKLKDAQVKKIELETELISFQEKLENRRSVLLEKQQAEREKAQKEQEKKDEERRKAEEKRLEEELKVRQNIEDLKVEAMLEGMEKEISQIELDTQRKIEALTGSAEQIAMQKALLLEIEEQQLAAVRDKYAKEYAEKDKKAKEEQEKRDLDASQKALELVEKTAKQKEAAEAAYLQAQGDFMQLAIDFLGQDEAARKKHANAIRVFTVGKIMVDLAREIQTIWANVAQYGPAGPVVGALQTGFAAGRAFFAINKVNKQKFSQGGLLNGPLHSSGGIPGVIRGSGQPIEMEGGEFVFSRKAVRAIGVGKLSRVNNYFTKRLATGGPVNPYQDRAPMASSRAKSMSVASGDASMSEMRSMFNDLISAVDRRFDRLKAYVVASEVDKALKVEAEIKADADV